jgi:GAF domain-containing protein
MNGGVLVHPSANGSASRTGWHDLLGDIGRARGRAPERDVNWDLSPGASLADLATIELRRITDVLQVDHASLFLRDADDPERTIAVAEAGLPTSEALPERCLLLTQVLETGRAAEVERFEGPGGPCCGALASPLVHEGRAVGALLVVTRRASRRLGAIDSQVVQRATRTLVERFLAPGERPERSDISDRFTRPARARR